MAKLPTNSDIPNLLWSFGKLDVNSDNYTTQVGNILKSINELRTHPVTTTMSAEKIDKWTSYVTGLENIIKTMSEADVYVKKMDNILKLLDDIRSHEVRNLMGSEKLVKWDQHVTALEDLIRGSKSDGIYDDILSRADKVGNAMTLLAAASEGLEFIPVIPDDLHSRDNDSDDSLPPLEMHTKTRNPDKDVVSDANRPRAAQVCSALTLFGAASEAAAREGLEFRPLIPDDLDSRDNDSDDSLPPLEMHTSTRYHDEDVVYDDIPFYGKNE